MSLSSYATQLTDWIASDPRSARIELDRELVRVGGLRAFTKLAWPAVEGAKPFVPGWHLDAIAEHLEAVSAGQINWLIINIPPRHMKLIADDVPIATPDGYRCHGDIRPGDMVFGPDGLPTRVLGVSPKGLADYEVECSTGEVIQCNGDHLWTVWDRWAKRWKTLDTAGLASLPTEGDRSRFFLPDTAPLQFEAKALPLDPYFFGCWLGDGSASKPCITHDPDDREHIERIVERGLAVSTVCCSGTAVATYFANHGVTRELKALGVFNAKRIPDIYATASDRQRLDLLAGLVDTDGHVDRKSGRVRISTCDPVLAEQIERLVGSLGFRAYISSAAAPGYGLYRSDKRVYQIGFQPNRDIPTALPRKRIARVVTERRRRAIVAIRSASTPKVGHCLKVERADGLYVVGRTNLVTHNSTSVGVMWPVWDWLRRPWRQFLTISYAQDLATRDAVKARRVIQSAWFQQTFGGRFQLTSDQNAKERYENNRGGYRIATAVDAKLTGEGGDIIVIDDPLNAKDKDSETKRVGANTWLDESASSRLNDQRTGAFVLVMQRLHEKDMTGHVLARERDGGGEVVHLCLPARYEPDHPYVYARDPRRTDGELLWPERFPEKALKRLENQLGPHATAGQLQQRPAPREGGLFDKGKVTIIDALPAQRYRRVRAWDLAASEKKQQKENPDFTVSADVRIGEDGFTYIVDVDRGRWNADEVEKRIVATASRDGTGTRIWLPQDPGQAGKWQAQRFVRLLAGYTVKIEPATGDKVVRANPLSAQWAAGNVRLVRGPWNDTLLAEFSMFPSGEHDDQVDAVAAGYNDLVEPMTGLLEFYEERAQQIPEEPKQDNWIVEKIYYGSDPDGAAGGKG